MTTSLRRSSLRRQIALLEGLRDALLAESEDDYERWYDALRNLTDKLLHELMELEGVPPYPHPRGTLEQIFPSQQRERRTSAVQPEGWRSMESAPRDGTPVLLARHVGDPWGWVTGHGRWDGAYGIFGWISHGFHPIPGELGLAHPDLWHPLPPAPPAPVGDAE